MAIAPINASSQNVALQAAQAFNNSATTAIGQKSPSSKAADVFKQSPIKSISHAHEIQAQAQKVGLTPRNAA